MSNTENKLQLYTKVAELTGYEKNQVAVIQQNVAKGTTASELAYFLNVCKTMELNPFNKEVWCYKDGKGNLLIFAGRDGFLSKAQKNPAFNGIRSCEVRENDLWELDIPNAEITHKITAKQSERGAIVGAYAMIFRKAGEPTIEWAEFDTYNKRYSAWKSHPAEMIKKVAEAHALKKAFGISGIQSEYDWNVKDGIAKPIQTENVDAKIILSDADLKKQIESITDHDELIDFALNNEIDTSPELSESVRKRIAELT